MTPNSPLMRWITIRTTLTTITHLAKTHTFSLINHFLNHTHTPPGLGSTEMEGIQTTIIARINLPMTTSLLRVIKGMAKDRMKGGASGVGTMKGGMTRGMKGGMRIDTTIGVVGMMIGTKGVMRRMIGGMIVAMIEEMIVGMSVMIGVETDGMIGVRESIIVGMIEVGVAIAHMCHPTNDLSMMGPRMRHQVILRPR